MTANNITFKLHTGQNIIQLTPVFGCLLLPDRPLLHERESERKNTSEADNPDCQ